MNPEGTKLAPRVEPRAEPLRCSDLSFAYGKGRPVNEAINLSVDRGQIFGLLGPNGAGKTTFIRLITGQLRPMRGAISIFGIDLSAAPRKAMERVGIIPQDAGLFEPLTVGRNLEFFARLKGVAGPGRKAHIASIAKECGLDGLLSKRAGSLSFGQKRKLLLGLAFLGDPGLLILDEPTIGLDPVTRRELWSALRRRKQAGRSILVTTHYLDEAEQLCDRLAIIDGGRIRASGALDDFFGLVGKTVVLKILDGSCRKTVAEELFDTYEEARKHLIERDYANFQLGRLTLEDIYLRYVGTKGREAE